MAKALREGAAYNQRDVMEVLSEFSSFKDRVEKKFKDVARELNGKSNEHELWVSLYMISSDYAEDLYNKRQKTSDTTVQKIS